MSVLLVNRLDELYVTIVASKTGTPKGDASPVLTLADLTLSGPIEDLTGDAVNPIVVTSTAHGLETGDLVCLMNVVGNKPANGPKTVTKINANTFSLGVAGVGDWIDSNDVNDERDKPIWCRSVPGVHAASMSVYDADTGEYEVDIERDVNLIPGRDYIGYLEVSYPGEDGVDVGQIQIQGQTARL